jgi:hypothetical protein
MAEVVTLDFLAKQQKQILDRLGNMEDQQTVLTGIAMRLDGSLQGFAVEMRGMYSLLLRLDRRVREIENTGDA